LLQVQQIILKFFYSFNIYLQLNYRKLKPINYNINEK